MSSHSNDASMLMEGQPQSMGRVPYPLQQQSSLPSHQEVSDRRRSAPTATSSLALNSSFLPRELEVASTRLSTTIPRISSHFQGAQNATVHGGHFLNTHGHHTNIIVNLPEAGRDGEDIGRRESDNDNVDHVAIFDEMREQSRQTLMELPVQSSNKVYERHLLLKEHGFPLWIPEPSKNLSMPYRRQGISIGDVGIITPRGSFSFLFNICLPADDPINIAAPEEFSPIYSSIPSFDIDTDAEFTSGSFLASHSIIKSGRESDNTAMSFESQSLEGAILVMPEGAVAYDLLNISGFRKYASANIESWYRYVNGPRGREARNGDIRLVIGCHKSTSWGMAAMSNVSQEMKYSLKLVSKKKPSTSSPSTEYIWECSGAVESRAGPDANAVEQSRVDDPDSSSDYQNQCLFIRTMNITLSDAQWEKVNRDLGLVHSPNDDTTETRTSKNPEGHAHQNSSQSGSKTSDARSKGSRIPVRRRAELPNNEHTLSLPEGTETSLSPPLIHPFHPADELNRLLLKQNPTARIVVTEDKDWYSAIDKDTDQFPPADELCARVLERCVVRYENDGAIFLESTQSPKSSLRLAADGKIGYAGPGPLSQSMKISNQDMKLEDLGSDDIVLMCIGFTGTGKSTLIDHLCRQPGTRGGSQLNSCTHEVEMVRIKGHPIYQDRIVIVDTPGFNDTELSNMESLGIISKWLRTIYLKHIPLRGILYVHQISDNRISGIQQGVLGMFRELCGIDVSRNVMFVTTMWEEVKMDFAEKNEEELQRRYWRSMIDCGASTKRFWNTSQSALDVLNSFLRSHPVPAVPLKIQREVVDMKRPVAETKAAQALYLRKKVAVLLLGLTGAGKSTFVNAATGKQDAEVNKNLTATDLHIREFFVDHPNDFTTLVLIDTPGFNNLITMDKHLLRTIMDRLSHSMFKDVSFGGILYLHDITQSRKQSSIGTIILKLLSSPEPTNHLLMATTKWGRARGGQTSLKWAIDLENRAWKHIMEKDALIDRFDGTQSSAWRLIDLLLDREPLEFDVAIQELQKIHDLSGAHRNPPRILIFLFGFILLFYFILIFYSKLTPANAAQPVNFTRG